METLDNKQTGKLNLSPGVIATVVVYICASGLMLASKYRYYPDLHIFLDAGLFILSGICALFLWNMSIQRASFPNSLAISFAITFLLEFIHAVTGLEWSGPLAFINQSVNAVRQGTWPPPAYLLPIGVGYSIWTLRHDKQQKYTLGFALILVLLSIAFLAVFDRLPRYTTPIWLGIARPTLIPVPLLWIAVGLACWRMRAEERILPALMWMAAVLVTGSAFMLYSRAPHDTLAMVAHRGKVGGYLILLLSMLEMASIDMVQRIHAEEKFRGLNVELERRVIERTAQLQAEIAERLQVDLLRQQTQTQLNRSEEHKATILDTSLDAIITIDHMGHVLEFNPAAQKIFGYTAGEVLGKEMSQLIIPPSLREQHRNGLANYLATGEGPVLGKRIEMTGMHADGTEFPVELTITLNAGGELPVFTGFVRDITQRKQAEKILRQSEERFRLIVEAAPSAMIAVDRDGKIDLVNAKAQELFGYYEEELLGRSVEMLVPQRFRSGHPNYRQSFLAQPISRPMGAGRDLFGLHKDGHEVPVEIGLTPYETSEGLFTLALIVDITERKQALEKIAYQAYLLENVNDAVIGSDENSFIRFWNQGAERMLGWKAEEVLGRSGREILRSELINTDREVVLKILAERGRWKGESIQYHKDGTPVIVEASSITLRNPDNSIAGYVSVQRDIRERKLAEEELRKHATRTQALADISGTLAAVHLDYQAVLDATARHTTELIGDACAIRLVSDDGQWLEVVSLYHPEPKTLAFLHEMLAANPLRTDVGLGAQVIQTGRPVLIPVISPEQLKAIVPSTASSILEHINIHSLLVVPLRAQGGVLGTLTLTRDQPDRPYTSEDQAFLQDLADRAALSIANARLYTAMQQLNNKLEQRVSERTVALSEANNLLQMMLDHMPDQIYFKDAQSRFIRNSRSQAKALGLNDPAEAVGKSDFDFFPHAKLSFEKEQEIIRSGKPLVDEEERVVWPDGRETWVSTTKVPLPDQTGQVIGTIVISRDITDRKQAETALQKAKLELEAANKELEAFSYSVSHDLRSPLRTIDGFSQALLEDYADQLPAEGQNYLKRVRAATQRMGQLIDDLLNLSKVTRAPMKFVPVDLSGLVQGIAAELQRTQPERRVNFKITPNLKARGDPNLMQAALENLLNNAWKFTAKREQAEIEFGSKSENNETVFFIRDNGAGFDMAYVGKLFGAFQRLHAMTEFSGTGIGLATVQRIINRHGGRIWAEGAVDQGATFFFTLPALERAKPEATPQEKDSLARRVREII